MKTLSSTLLVLFCFFLMSSCNSLVDNTKPNFLFILADDLGWTDLGYTGSKFHETPNIDKLASQGMIFTDAYAACPVCSPSRAAILSGKYPARLNLTDYIPGNRSYGPHKDQQMTCDPFKLQMDLEEYTIAEAMKDAGYVTFFAGKWHVCEDEKYYPTSQGFDINKGGNNTGHPASGYFSPYNNPQLPDGTDGEYLTDRLTDEVISFIEKNKDTTFFAYLSFYTVHLPMQGKPDKVEKYQVKLSSMNYEGEEFTQHGITYVKHHQNMPHFAAMVESMDENIGRLLNSLKKAGIEDNTVVIFTSDNGGMATSNITNNIPTSNDPLRAGKGYLYEGGIREPMIIKWPNKIKGGSAIDTPVTGTDFYPTILDLAGLDLNPGQHMDGLSLEPLIFDNKLDIRPIYWHFPHYSGGLGGRPSGAVRLGDYKLIEFYEDMHIELYNVHEDLSEKNDLTAEMPDKANELKELLHKWRIDVNAQMPYPNKYFTGKTSPDTLLSEDYHELRGGVGNSYAKFIKDKKGRVAFLGGSITFNGGWRDSICKYLEERFPDTEFDFIAAGIPSMGTPSAAFRFERDILKNGPVDLLFEEAAANDAAIGHSTQEQISADFVDVPMIIGDQPGKILEFRFSGNAVGLAVAAGPDAGIIEYRVDRKK